MAHTETLTPARQTAADKRAIRTRLAALGFAVKAGDVVLTAAGSTARVYLGSVERAVAAAAAVDGASVTVAGSRFVNVPR